MLTLAAHTGTVRCLAYSPDGRQLASGAEDGFVCLWDLSRRAVACTWPDQSDSVEAIAFTPNGSRLFAGRADGDLVCIDPANARPRWKATAHAGGVRSVLAHPSGDRMFTAGWDREVCAWTVRRPQRTRLVVRLDEPVAAAALSPDGQALAVALCHTYKVHLVYPDSRKNDTSLGSDAGAVFALAFAPGGSVLAAGDTLGRVGLWALADLTRPHFLEGHTGVVYGLGFTPDGRRLVSTGQDQTARVWEASTGRLVQEYQWHQNWATCLAVAPDGLTVATAGEDRVVAVWDLPE